MNRSEDVRVHVHACKVKSRDAKFPTRNTVWLSKGALGLHMRLNRPLRGIQLRAESKRLVIYCQTTSVSTAHATHCATYCTPNQPLMRAFSGSIRTPPPASSTWNTATRGQHAPSLVGSGAPTGAPRNQLIRNRRPLGPYSRTMPWVLWWS